MVRLLGFIFSALSIGAIFAVVALAAIVHLYGRELPDSDELINYQPKMVSRVFSGEGKVIAEFYEEKRIFVPIDEVPEMVRYAFISAEDKNFYEHPGVDITGIVKAVFRFAKARITGRDARLSGASTITQQVMKNFLVGNERSFERKIKEAILAVRFDGALSKDQILELYLNEIFFGARSYGIMTAAQNYFGKTLEELEPQEAAYLAALPKEPSRLHPIRNRKKAISRRNYVLEEMAQNGYLTRDEADKAKAAPLDTLIGGKGPAALASAEQDYFTGEVRRQLTSELGSKELFDGGLTIRATVNPRLQELAGQVLRRGLETYDRERSRVYRGPVAVLESVAAGEKSDWRAALRAVDAPRDIPGWVLGVVLDTGKSTALVGLETDDPDDEIRLKLSGENWINRIERGEERSGKPKRPEDLWRLGDVIYVGTAEDGKGWSMRQIPEVEGAFMAMDPFSGRVLAMQGGFSYQHSVFNRATQAKRQPGSAFKPFVYAAALDAGFTPATIVLDAPVVVRQDATEDWRPKNSSGKFYGPTPMRVGLELSRNLMTVRIAQQVGMDRVAVYAERFGVYKDMPLQLSYALGAGEVTLNNLVAAYGMFLNGGKKVVPTVVDRVQDRHGKTLYSHDPRSCKGCDTDSYAPDQLPMLFDRRSQIMNPVTAFQLVSMLEGVVQRGTGRRTVGGLDFPVAGKTGTTNDSKDAWFIGFSPSIVAGCFIGYDNPRSLGRHAYGGTLCGPVFREFMKAAMEGQPPGEFRAPTWEGMVTVKLDRNSGERLPDDAEGPNVISESFRAGSEPALYERAAAIAGDDALFGVYESDLPYTLNDLAGTSEAADGAPADNGRPKPPGPPKPTGVGLGTGGLY